jgi:hypothetical protein
MLGRLEDQAESVMQPREACRCAAVGETRQCEVGRRIVITIPRPKFFLGISGRLRPQNVTIWDDPGNGEPAEICPGKVHIGVLEDVTEEHEQYDVDPAHFGLKLSRSHSKAVGPFEGVSKASTALGEARSFRNCPVRQAGSLSPSLSIWSIAWIHAGARRTWGRTLS